MRLLACDDHHMFLDALRDVLAAHGHEVAAVTADPAEVPALVERHRPDVVLLDVQLPGTTGVQLAGELREQHAGLPLVLLTGSTQEWVWQAYEAGVVDGLVSKVSGIGALDQALRRVQAGGRAVVGWPQGVRTIRRQTSLDLLTDRERQVLTLMTDGATTAVMAERLGISVNTVRAHVRCVLQKLGVHRRVSAAHSAIVLGLVPSG